ncbi:hypothetical protein BDR26DRAFT_865356 [Obelidium mucronatum]|nr:hypothetical protein BDR26DRAFT_865356 [Obelidium mucronatum]
MAETQLTYRFKVAMKNAECRLPVTTELWKIPGVKNVEVSFDNQTVTVRHIGVTEEQLVEAIKSSGTTEVVEREFFTFHFKVGMKCSGCCDSLKELLAKIPEVKSVKLISRELQRVSLVADFDTIDSIEEALKKNGRPVKLMPTMGLDDYLEAVCGNIRIFSQKYVGVDPNLNMSVACYCDSVWMDGHKFG